ncbi:uncharacterized protein LOC124899563 [Capsicum annuum]|uniref:uncharacterized protein LOC124899563 n=1 Tax=Capsicum annuum TaxID=4072 RepID=UPI001FB062D0|nr:uncharacterized protein LOC124899563 [Capsicum annuum]
MTIFLRYVNKEGKLIERFLGLVHVKDISTKSLKEAIYTLLLDHSLSRSEIRGQGYDGASNMKGELNDLKTLILKYNSSAYCIYYFAHQLQLTLVVVAKKHYDVNNIFDILTNVLNIVGGSFKCREMLRDVQDEKLKELLVHGEVHTKLNSRFNEVNIDLLLGMGSLSSKNSFMNYDKNKIIKLVTYDPNEFSASKLEDLSLDLDNYIYYMRDVANAFSNLQGLGCLSMKLVETICTRHGDLFICL